MILDREGIKNRYAAAAGSVKDPMMKDGGACGGSFYDHGVEGLPEAVLGASLGCANPVALADLHQGETVLDLGSGAGLDVLLSAKRVGPSGTAYGLDMVDEMLELASKNAAEAEISNARFLKGYIEDIPLPAENVDVILSNCVINLSLDKPAVFREMIRVLRPGGRLAIADIVADDGLDEETRAKVARDSPCLATALTWEEYRLGLEAVGFHHISITAGHSVADGFTSVIVRAGKPPLIV